MFYLLNEINAVKNILFIYYVNDIDNEVYGYSYL
jgi:hypothetical protein